MSHNRLLLHPGQSEPTRVSIPVWAGEGPSEIQVAVRRSDRCPNADGVFVSLYLDDELRDQRLIAPGDIDVLPLDEIEKRRIDLVVGKNENPSCDIVVATFSP